MTEPPAWAKLTASVREPKGEACLNEEKRVGPGSDRADVLRISQITTDLTWEPLNESA